MKILILALILMSSSAFAYEANCSLYERISVGEHQMTYGDAELNKFSHLIEIDGREFVCTAIVSLSNAGYFIDRMYLEDKITGKVTSEFFGGKITLKDFLGLKKTECKCKIVE